MYALASYLEKNPKLSLMACIANAALTAGFLYGSFSLERPSILIIFSVLTASAFTAQAIRYRDMLAGDGGLCLALDARGALQAMPSPSSIDMRQKHVVVVKRTWIGFRIVVFGPQANLFQERVESNPMSIQGVLQEADASKKRVVVVRDYRPQEPKKKVDKNLN
ncbi:hypothetical protein IT407_00055 [Candidatus Uhrbacteria bacterium]|nr:hypothetical protein [Candidatus Uhrbacteria bacterium]